MEIRIPSAFLAAALILPASTVAQDPPDGEPSADVRLAARVNGEDISLQELSVAVNQYVSTNRLGPDSGMTIPKIQNKVLNRLIATALVDQRGRELGLTATVDEVEERVSALRAQVGSPEDFRLMLTVQNLRDI